MTVIKDFVTERLKLKDVYPDRAKAVAEESGIDIDDLELIRKGIVAEKAQVDKAERSVTSYINTAAKDRDNEVILPKGVVLTHYRKNPVVPYGHDYRGLPVAKNIWIKKDDKGLLAKTVFLDHAFAEDVYRLYSESVAGTGPAMKAWSIGFIPLKWEDSKVDEDNQPKRGERDTNPKRTYKKWELLEYSAVMIPSNPEALTQMVEKGLIKSDKLKKEIEDFIIETEEEDEVKGKERKVTIMTEEEILSEIIKAEQITEEVCPKCEGSCARDSEGYYCEHCEWVEHDEPEKNPIPILKRLITKPEEIGDNIYIPAKGQEGKHRGHKIRWITVSAKKGIRGIYCIDDKIIITYVFDKKKGWTVAKALKWMKDNGKEVETTINLCSEDEPNFQAIQDLLDLDDENREFAETIEKDGDNNEETIEVDDDQELIDEQFEKRKDGKVKPLEELIGKRPDLQGNPSVWDVIDAIDVKINIGIIPHRNWVCDLYPVKYPNGNCVVCIRERETRYFLYPYTYDDGEIEFGEATELEQTYKPKREVPEEAKTDELINQMGKLTDEIKSLKEGRVLSEKNRKLILNVLVAMEAVMPPLRSLLTATEPPKRDDFELVEGDPDLYEIDGNTEGNGDDNVNNEDTKKLEIDTEQLTAIVQGVFKNNLEKIGEMVADRIAKAKGKVE